MKKVFALLLSAGVITIISCGPSAEEKAKAEQATKDSIELVRVQDSTMQAQAIASQEAAMKDSLDKAQMQAQMDSLMNATAAATAEAKAASAKAASAKSASDKTKKQLNDQKINTTVKPGQGRG